MPMTAGAVPSPRRCLQNFWNLTEIGRYLNVSAERARQVAASDRTFPSPVIEHPRRWRRAKVERWGERYWWDTAPWRSRPGGRYRSVAFL
jgi:hypothetical protein